MNQIIWNVNNMSLQSASVYPVLSDAIAGVYHSTLIITSNQPGSYSCFVTDENGSNIKQIHHQVIGKYSLSL